MKYISNIFVYNFYKKAKKAVLLLFFNEGVNFGMYFCFVLFIEYVAQSAGTIEYTNCFSAEE